MQKQIEAAEKTLIEKLPLIFAEIEERGSLVHFPIIALTSNTGINSLFRSSFIRFIEKGKQSFTPTLIEISLCREKRAPKGKGIISEFLHSYIIGKRFLYYTGEGALYEYTAYRSLPSSIPKPLEDKEPLTPMQEL